MPSDSVRKRTGWLVSHAEVGGGVDDGLVEGEKRVWLVEPDGP
jgi:hypothetical protein